jgi:hypothetical protein
VDLAKLALLTDDELAAAVALGRKLTSTTDA